jgi:PAS domain S-box-containing protein
MTPTPALDILVIEDDPDTRDNLRDILELDDHRVVLAGTAAEALARRDWSRFSVIILDRKLPDAGADVVLPKLRAAAPGAGVIVVTGFADLDGAIAALRQGAADYILKPLNADELRARIGRIAENQRADAAQRSAEQRYRLLVRNSSDIITTFDANGTILFESPSIERVLGRRSEDRVGTNILRDPIVHPDDLPAKRAFLAEALARPGVPVTADFRLRHVDGSYRDIEAVGTNLLADSDFGAIVASYRDATARKRAEQALRVSEERFRLLVEAAECVITILRPDRSILYFSPYAEALTGYDAREVQGRDFSEVLISEPNRGPIREGIEPVLAGRHVRGEEAPLVCRDGSRRWMVWNARLLSHYEEGPAVLCVGQDITAVKQAQERALQAERLAAVGEVVAGLAHESRNAMQRSQACLEMLALADHDRPASLDLIARVQKAQDQLHRLYEDVRGYAAPIQLERRPCDLQEVYREAWAHLELERQGKRAELREGEGCDDLRCVADPFRLGQVFHNILDNALAAGRTPVQVTVQGGPAVLDGQPAVRVAVSDNGPGIDRENQGRVFDPFFTTKSKGTGLGLAIARRIVEAHGGRVDVGEGAGPGAVFLITLPRGTP